MKKELKELIGILNYKEWGFRMYKKLSNEYVIGVILGNEELECSVYDEKGLKALMFDVVNFDKDEYIINNISDRLEEFLNVCIDTKSELEIMNVGDFEYRYDFECEDGWVIRVVIENDVYIVPYKNTDLITSLIFRLASPYTSVIEYNDGNRIIVDSEFNVLRFKVEFGGKFIVFDNVEYAKKFIDNNMKGE